MCGQITILSFVWDRNNRAWHIFNAKVILLHLEVLTVNLVICATSLLKSLLFLFIFYDEHRVYLLIDRRNCKKLSFHEIKSKHFVSGRGTAKNFEKMLIDELYMQLIFRQLCHMNQLIPNQNLLGVE